MDNKKRILAISDIHGCYDELELLLQKVKYNPNEDQLILLGDYVDRGQKSTDVLDLAIKLVDNGAIALRGNHDQMFLDFLFKSDYTSRQLYLSNGGLSTLESYVGFDWFEGMPTNEDLYNAKKFILENYNDHVTFLYHLPYYHQIGNHLFVHAGINPDLSDWRNTSEKDMIWIREQFLFSRTRNDDLIVLHGHTPCKNTHGSHDIDFRYNRIGIDGACAYGGQLNCLIIEDGEYKEESIRKGVFE